MLSLVTKKDSEKRIIYDIGSNNGDDIPYYLMKCDVVVAVEANPVLFNRIKARFAKEINEGRVFVENFVVIDKQNLGKVDFYIHKLMDVLSQFPKPSEDNLFYYDIVKLPSISIIDIINKYGTPYYIKFDVEHYEVPLLKCLFKHNIRPQFISAESHSWDVFEIILNEGQYKLFKLVTGWSVSLDYSNRLIKNYITNNNMKYSFPEHSAGPFGDDIDGDWMDSNIFKILLSNVDVGWKDIHATN